MQRIASHRVIDLKVEKTAGEARSIITTFLKVRCLYPRIWLIVRNRREADEGKIFILFLVPVGSKIMASQRCLHLIPGTCESVILYGKHED